MLFNINLPTDFDSTQRRNQACLDRNSIFNSHQLQDWPSYTPFLGHTSSTAKGGVFSVLLKHHVSRTGPPQKHGKRAIYVHLLPFSSTCEQQMGHSHAILKSPLNAKVSKEEKEDGKEGERREKRTSQP